MADKRQYTNFYEVLIDMQLYAIYRRGGVYNLAVMQPIAQSRWSWMVDNWATLYKRFSDSSGGDERFEAALVDLDNEVTSYNLGNDINPFEDFDKYVNFRRVIQLITFPELKLTPDEVNLKNKEIERISNLEIEDFQEMVAFLKQQVVLYEYRIGLGDPDAARLAGIEGTERQRDATIDDLFQISLIRKTQQLTEGVIFDLQLSQKRPPNLLRIANLNIESGSQVEVNETFRTYIPIPFEISLEHMAKKYLADASLWYELVTINNLQPPFVDESGEKYDLLAPAAVNNLIISSARKEWAPVGTKIGIGSHKHREEKRIIERVIVNENDTMVLFLSGDQDLNKFSPAHKAYVRLYKPHTTRNGEFVLVPSTSAPSTPRAQPTPSADELRRLEKAFVDFGFDIARDAKTHDFVIGPNGNFKFAAGVPSVRQAVLYALKTVRGELNFHKGYGVNVNLGAKYYGTVDEALLFGELLRNTIIRDPRFKDMKISRISTTATGISLQLLVSIKGFDKPIPLSFVS
jgi:hypothetical protein